MVKQGDTSAVCELDLTGLEDAVTVLSGTTDNVALLDRIRDDHGDDPEVWLPLLLNAVHLRKTIPERRAALNI
jgi:type IV secretion system protein VirB4